MAASAKEFNQNIDLKKNQLLQVALENLASAPSSPATAQLYWNTTDTTAYIWDGTAWQDLLGGGGGPENRGLYVMGEVSVATQMDPDEIWVTDGAGVDMTLPDAPEIGTRQMVAARGGTFTIVQNTLDKIVFPNPNMATTPGATGYVNSVEAFSVIYLVYNGVVGGFQQWSVISYSGTFHTDQGQNNKHSTHNRYFTISITRLSSDSGGVVTYNDLPGKPVAFWMIGMIDGDTKNMSNGFATPNVNQCQYYNEGTGVQVATFSALTDLRTAGRGWAGRIIASRYGEVDILWTKYSTFGHNTSWKLMMEFE